MKAMVYTGPLTLELQDVPVPEVGPGEVLVRVSAVGICGSELEGFVSRSPFRVPPLIMGHECVGTREDTGELVAVNPLVSCGHCKLCLRGLTNICRRRSIIGIQRPGAFAEFVAVPEGNLFPLPDGLPLSRSVLIEPAANAVHAFRLAQEHDALPERVGIIGAGTIGFMCTAVALSRGAPEVSVSDMSATRRRLAEASGATSVVEELEGEFDSVFDTVGTSETRRMSVALLRPGGTAVWLGLHGPGATSDGLDLIRNEKQVLGSFCYDDQDFRGAIALAVRGSLPVPAFAPLQEGVETFHRLADGDVNYVKTVLQP